MATGTPTYNVRVFGGANHMTVDVVSVGPAIGQDMHDVTTLLHESKQFQPGRLNDELAMSVRLNPDQTAGTVYAEIKSWIQSSAGAPFTVGLHALTAGGFAWLGSQVMSKRAIVSTVDAPVTLNLSFASKGQALFGYLLTGLQTITTTTTGATVDNGAATTGGAIATIHLPTVTGTPTVTGKVQDSADGSSWADVSGLTFTGVTARGAQLLSITGTVRRYRRAVCTVTGGTTPTAQCLVALATY